MFFLIYRISLRHPYPNVSSSLRLLVWILLIIHSVIFIHPTKVCRIMVWCVSSVRTSINVWLCTRVTTCRISFNFTDIINLACPIHDTGRVFKFGTVGALNRLININPGFTIVAKWYFKRLFDTFSGYVHWEGTVYTINKKYHFFNFILDIHIHWDKALGAFKNQHSSSLNMCILTQFLIFAFWSFLRPYIKLEPSNLVQLEHWAD